MRKQIWDNINRQSQYIVVRDSDRRVVAPPQLRDWNRSHLACSEYITTSPTFTLCLQSPQMTNGRYGCGSRHHFLNPLKESTPVSSAWSCPSSMNTSANSTRFLQRFAAPCDNITIFAHWLFKQDTPSGQRLWHHQYYGKPLDADQKTQLAERFNAFRNAQESGNATAEMHMVNIKGEEFKPPTQTGRSTCFTQRTVALTHDSCIADHINVPVVLYLKVTIAWTYAYCFWCIFDSGRTMNVLPNLRPGPPWPKMAFFSIGKRS